MNYSYLEKSKIVFDGKWRTVYQKDHALIFVSKIDDCDYALKLFREYPDPSFLCESERSQAALSIFPHRFKEYIPSAWAAFSVKFCSPGSQDYAEIVSEGYYPGDYLFCPVFDVGPSNVISLEKWLVFSGESIEGSRDVCVVNADGIRFLLTLTCTGDLVQLVEEDESIYPGRPLCKIIGQENSAIDPKIKRLSSK